MTCSSYTSATTSTTVSRKITLWCVGTLTVVSCDKSCKSVASLDIFSLGYILSNILKQCKARYPALEVLASMALSSDPAQRPSMAKLAKVVKSYTPLQEKTSKNTAVFRYLRKFCSCLFPSLNVTQKKNTVKLQSVSVKH